MTNHRSRHADRTTERNLARAAIFNVKASVARAKRFLTAFMSSSAARKPLNWFYPACRETAVKRNYDLPTSVIE